MAVLEPKEEHDGGPPLFLCPWEIIHDEVPAQRYLVRLCLIEFQDWHTPPLSDDDDYVYCDSDSDNGDNNYNGYWPSFTNSGSAGSWPRMMCFGAEQDPRLGREFRPTFQPRQVANIIRVGEFHCPVMSLHDAIPCLPFGSRISTEGATHVTVPMV
jgi:hypothetical protein